MPPPHTKMHQTTGASPRPTMLFVTGERYAKATDIVRRVDDLGCVVIPKEIRRTMRIREGDPLLTTLTLFDRFCMAVHSVVERAKSEVNFTSL